MSSAAPLAGESCSSASRQGRPCHSSDGDEKLSKSAKTAKASRFWTGQRYFYTAQLLAFLAFWLRIRLKTGRHYYDVTAGLVATRPSWLPASWLLRLHSWRRPVLLALPLALAAGACRAERLLVRLVVAVSATLYHLLESSVSNRHGEYPVLYNAWAMLLPDKFAQALALGVSTHFVFASGLAKLQVGGAAWLKPDTMRTYLDTYRGSRSSPPLSPALSGWLAARDWAMSGISLGTLVLECGLLPLGLLLPQPWRQLGTMAMVGLHAGIATVMSGNVGFLFLTTVPSYLVGFSSNAALGSREWLAAVSTALGPSLFAMLRGRALEEDWPITPVALFMWAGETAEALRRGLMTEDTRLVLYGSSTSPLGLPVLGNIPELPQRMRGQPVLHDVLARAIGFTVAQGALVDGALKVRRTADGWDMASLVESVNRWLQEGRLLELSSGRPLDRAAFVRLGQGRAVELLQEAGR